MHCVEIREPGGPDVLRLVERDLPEPGSREVMIRVAAAGVNRPDVFQRRGLYPPPPGASDIPGLEVAGEIVRVGPDCSASNVGDEVCALLTGGGYAEYAVADERCCLPIPRGLSMIEAAALPETFFTVWNNLFERAALKAGEILLVHGGAGGIGTTAISMATALGARVFATAGSGEKCSLCLELGAEGAINYREQDFVGELRAFTGGHGADVILDMVGGDYVQRNIDVAAFRGRIVMIAFLKGSRSEVDLMPLMLKQLVLTGSTLRARPVDEKARIADGLRDNVWPLIDAGEVRPSIGQTFALHDASRAHALMDDFGHSGKLVLVPG